MLCAFRAAFVRKPIAVFGILRARDAAKNIYHAISGSVELRGTKFERADTNKESN